MNKTKGLLAIAIAGCLTAGCAGTYTKQDTGTAIGAITGGALTYGLAKDSSNKGVWTVLGLGLGAMLGSHIGAQLDEKDRLLAAQTFDKSMETSPSNQVRTWQNPDSGNHGSFTPTATTVTASGQPCREFTQTVSIGGKQQEAYGRACRQADGSWKIIQ